MQPRGDVRARIERIREDLVLYLAAGDNQTGQMPLNDLLSIVRKVVGDQRSVKKYVWTLLPQLKMVEPLNRRVVQVNVGPPPEGGGS